MHRSVDMCRHFSDLISQRIDINGHLHLCTLLHKHTLSSVFSRLPLAHCAANHHCNEKNSPTQPIGSHRPLRRLTRVLRALLVGTAIFRIKITSTQIGQNFIKLQNNVSENRTCHSGSVPATKSPSPVSGIKCPLREGGASDFARAQIYAAARPAAVHPSKLHLASSGAAVSRPFTRPFAALLLDVISCASNSQRDRARIFASDATSAHLRQWIHREPPQTLLRSSQQTLATEQRYTRHRRTGQGQ